MLIFVILSIGFYFLFTGIFGENGYLKNRELKIQLEEKETHLLKLNSQIESLSQKNEELSTEEGLREAALKLGYNVKGDEVFVFESSSLQKNQKEALNENNPERKEFKPFSSTIIVLMALVSSVLISIILNSICKPSEIEGEEINDI